MSRAEQSREEKSREEKMYTYRQLIYSQTAMPIPNQKSLSYTCGKIVAGFLHHFLLYFPIHRGQPAYPHVRGTS